MIRKITVVLYSLGLTVVISISAIAQNNQPDLSKQMVPSADHHQRLFNQAYVAM